MLNKDYAAHMEVKSMKTINTSTCLVCGQQGKVLVTAEQYDLYYSRGDKLIQEVLNDLDKEYREQIISGTHPACWDAVMDGHDDDPKPTSPMNFNDTNSMFLGDKFDVE